jgi:hypothetical protein
MSLSSNDLLKRAFQASPRYQPKSANVLHRAVELGFDPEDSIDSSLLWIAEKSLQTDTSDGALPEGWIECYSDEGYKYFWNDQNEESSWVHPNLFQYQTLFQKLRADIVSGQRPIDTASSTIVASVESTPPLAVDRSETITAFSQPKRLVRANTLPPQRVVQGDKEEDGIDDELKNDKTSNNVLDFSRRDGVKAVSVDQRMIDEVHLSNNCL